MGSELCKTCIHTKVCMKDKNLIGDVFVMGHPMFFDNSKLYKKYEERKEQGFPCEDYMPTAEPKKGEWDKDSDTAFYWKCSECGAYLFCRKEDYLLRTEDNPNFCPNCGADMRGEEDE